MKNSNDTIGNRTRDLPTCNAVPQPTALPRAPLGELTLFKSWSSKLGVGREASSLTQENYLLQKFNEEKRLSKPEAYIGCSAL